MSRFEDFQIQILYEICENSYKPGSLPTFNWGQIESILPKEKISGAVYVALEALREQGHLTLTPGSSYALTASGMAFIEIGLADPGSKVSKAVRSNTEEGTRSGSGLIPAADRIVSLDHNQDAYAEAVRSLDAAVLAFREDRSFENEWVTEKNVLLQTIEAGRELLRKPSAHVATIYATIINPLRTLLGKYQHAMAEGIAKASFEQLMHLAGKAINSIISLLGLS